MVYIKVHYREQKGYTIMDAGDINRAKQIMKERGMKPSNFYRNDNYGKDDEFVRLTKTRFHRVLRGDIKHTGDDFMYCYVPHKGTFLIAGLLCWLRLEIIRQSNKRAHLILIFG